MRRIDALGIGFGIFLAGGLANVILQGAGLDHLTAGIWSQVLLVGGLIGWLLTYVIRAFTQKMTYNQQLKDYEETVISKRFAEMTPEELAQVQAEIEQQKDS